MHEFICCENNSNCFVFNSQEMNLEENSLYLNPFYLLFTGKHFSHGKSKRKSLLQFPCKENYCLNDLFHPVTSLMLTNKPAEQNSNKKKNEKKEEEELWKLFIPVLSMDSCLIQCGRCFSYLGDGLLSFNDNDDEPTNNSGKEQEEDEEMNFQLKDIQSVKLNYQNISIQGNLPSFSDDQSIEFVSTFD
jgi:Pyruvate/2-oxoacid:ferredoxin oxidoreductase delta subunit